MAMDYNAVNKIEPIGSYLYPGIKYIEQLDE